MTWALWFGLGGLVFSLLLGGMVGIISRSGGTVGVVDVLASGATSRRHGQMTTWFMGIAIFLPCLTDV